MPSGWPARSASPRAWPVAWPETLLAPRDRASSPVPGTENDIARAQMASWLPGTGDDTRTTSGAAPASRPRDRAVPLAPRLRDGALRDDDAPQRQHVVLHDGPRGHTGPVLHLRPQHLAGR